MNLEVAKNKTFDTHYVPHRRGGGHIVFGADPVDFSIGVDVTLSCLHDIPWTSGWILTEFAWM